MNQDDLRSKASEVGISKGAVQERDDENDPDEAAVQQILAKTPSHELKTKPLEVGTCQETVQNLDVDEAPQAAASQQILMNMNLGELKNKALEVGMNQEIIQKFDDENDPREAAMQQILAKMTPPGLKTEALEVITSRIPNAFEGGTSQETGQNSDNDGAPKHAASLRKAVAKLFTVPSDRTDDVMEAAREVRHECANKLQEHTERENSEEVVRYYAMLQVIDDTIRHMETANRIRVIHCELKDFQKADTQQNDFVKLREQMVDDLMKKLSEENKHVLQVESDVFSKLKLRVQAEDIEATIETLKNAMKGIDAHSKKQEIERVFANLEQANKNAKRAAASEKHAGANMHKDSCHSCLLSLLQLLQARIDFESNQVEVAQPHVRGDPRFPHGCVPEGTHELTGAIRSLIEQQPLPEQLSDKHKATLSGAAEACGGSDWKAVTEDFLDDAQEINVFVSGQLTQCMQEKILELKNQAKNLGNKPLVIKASLPEFNRRGTKTMDSGNIYIAGPEPVELIPIDIQCFGTDLNDEIIGIFEAAASNIPGGAAKAEAAASRRGEEILRKAASELRFMFPVRSINEIVRTKCVKNGREFVNAVRRHGDSEAEAKALHKVEKFLDKVSNLKFSDFVNKHYEQLANVHAWIDDCFVREDWRKYLHLDTFLSNFGFTQKFISEWKEEQGGRKWFNYAVKWMTKAVDIFQLPGSVADVVNLIFAMLNKQPNIKDRKPIIDDVVATVRDFRRILEKEHWHKLEWVPTCMIHDSEMDDMLAWFLVRLICSKKNQKLVCLVQLPKEISTTLVKKAQPNDSCIYVGSVCGWKKDAKVQIKSGNNQDERVITNVESKPGKDAENMIDRIIYLDQPLKHGHDKGAKILVSKEQLIRDGFLAKGADPTAVEDLRQQLNEKDSELLDSLQAQYESRSTPHSRVIPFRDPDSMNFESVSLSACLIPPQTLFIVSQHEMRAFTGKYMWNGAMFECGKKRLRLHPVTGHWCFSLDVNGMDRAYYQIEALKRLCMPHTTLGWKFLVQPENRYKEFEELVVRPFQQQDTICDISQWKPVSLNWDEPLTVLDGKSFGVLRWCHDGKDKVLVCWDNGVAKYWNGDKNDWVEELACLPSTKDEFQLLWAATEDEIKVKICLPRSGAPGPELRRLTFQRPDFKAEWKALNAVGDVIDAENPANGKVKYKLGSHLKPIFRFWIPPANSPDTPPPCRICKIRDATCDAFTRCRKHTRQTENPNKSCFECPIYKEALAFLNELGIESWIDHKWDRCYCRECFTAAEDVIQKDDFDYDYAQIAPRGWVGFGVVASRYLRSDAQGQVDVEEDDVACESWPIKFHGCNPNKLPDILRHGMLARPGDRLINNMAMTSALRRNAQHPVFFTSPTVAYAGMQCFARPKLIDALPGKYGQAVLQCNQQDVCLKQQITDYDGDETLGFRQLGDFPEYGVCKHVSLFATEGTVIETLSDQPEKCRIRRVLIRTFDAPPTENKLEREFRNGVRHFVKPLASECETFRSPIDWPEGSETDDGTVWL